MPTDGPGYVVLRNETIPEPVVIVEEEKVIVEEVIEETSSTAIFFLVLIMIAFAVLIGTIIFIAYKNKFGKDKV